MDDDSLLKRSERAVQDSFPSVPGSVHRPAPARGETAALREVRGVQVIDIYAEIDLAVISALDEALDTAIRALATSESVADVTDAPGVDAPAPRVVLNLCPVDFLDSQGIRSLLGYRAALKELGGELIIAAEPGEVIRILETTGVDELFRIFDSLEKALTAA